MECNTNATPTLFSTYKASRLSRNYSRNHGSASSSRYIVGSVGKTCGKHLKFSNPNGTTSSSSSTGSDSSSGRTCELHKEQKNRNKNVAIATQVLNPSAIGGSLKIQRFDTFRPREDDEISFLSNKSRAVCSKVCYYGISIGVTIFMITGLIVAIGYMQSEKDKVSTRPVKLAQGQDFQFSTTYMPPSVLSGTTTTTSTVQPEEDENAADSSDNEVEEDDIDEVSLDEYQQGTEEMSEDTLQDDNKGEESEIEVTDEEGTNSTTTSSTNEEEEFQEEDPGVEPDRPLSEVRVKPPSDFKFDGLSFGFPIYRNTNNNKDNKGSYYGDIVDGINGNKGNNNDLGETETESSNGFSSSLDLNVPIISLGTPPSTSTPSTTEETETHEETKELETTKNINDLDPNNSVTNFSSLIDSTENNTEPEKGLSFDFNSFKDKHKSYANTAHSQQETLNNNPLHLLSSSTSLFSPDFSQNNNKLFAGLQDSHHHHQSVVADTMSPSFKLKSLLHLNGNEQIIAKASSRFSSSKGLYDNGNNGNFAIAIQTTPIAKLQTDIFDGSNDKDVVFQTSASEESGIDLESTTSLNRGKSSKSTHGNNRKFSNAVSSTNPPQFSNMASSNGNNANSNNNDGGSKTGGGRANKGARRGKVLRPLTFDDSHFEKAEISSGNNDKKDKPLVTSRPITTAHKKQKQRVKDNYFNSQNDDDSYSNDGELDIISTTIDNKPKTGSSSVSLRPGSTSITMPILDYKIDFGKFVTTTPSPPSTIIPLSATPTVGPLQYPDDSDNIEYQPIQHIPNPYPSFKFPSTTTTSSSEYDKPFNLEEYLQKHAHKGVTADSLNSAVPTTNGLNPSANINLDYSNLQSPESFRLDSTGDATAYSGTGISPSAGGTVASLALATSFPQQNQFSKRTFYNSESNTNDVTFARLLGPQPTSNHFGSTSSAGAAFNYFQPQTSFNFDASPSQHSAQNSNPYINLPSLNPISSSASTATQSFSLGANGKYTFPDTSNVDLPYPNIAHNTPTLNNNFNNAFSFQNNDDSSSNNGGGFGGSGSKDFILTTGSGQTPTYNTITQGVHLLTLLSGKIPASYNGIPQTYDQLSSGSSVYPSTSNFEGSSKPEFQDSGLANYFKGGDNNNNNWNFGAGPSQAPSYSPHPFANYATAPDFLPRRNFKVFDGVGDQDSSASSHIPSFSRVLQASHMEIGKSVKAFHDIIIPTTTPPPTVYQALLSKLKKGLETTKQQSPFSSKSIGIPLSISFNSNSTSLTQPSSSVVKSPESSSSELESMAPKSRKRLLQVDTDPMEVEESEVVMTMVSPPRGPSLSSSYKEPIRGPKSGFFS